jgi:hypothetical protein
MSSAAAINLFGSLIPSPMELVNHYEEGVERDKAHSRWKEEMGFAKEQFEYQKTQNDLMRDREDNAMQRKVKDMEAAGLNKLLAAGAPPAAAALGTTAGTSGHGGSHANRVTNFFKGQLGQLMLEGQRVGSEIELNKSLAGKADAEGMASRNNAITNYERLQHEIGHDQANIEISRGNLDVARQQQKLRELSHQDEVAKWLRDHNIRMEELEKDKNHLNLMRLIEQNSVNQRSFANKMQGKQLSLQERAQDIMDQMNDQQIKQIQQIMRLRTSSEIRNWIQTLIYAADTLMPGAGAFPQGRPMFPPSAYTPTEPMVYPYN